jgi:hypothetical protein
MSALNVKPGTEASGSFKNLQPAPQREGVAVIKKYALPALVPLCCSEGHQRRRVRNY